MFVLTFLVSYLSPASPKRLTASNTTGVTSVPENLAGLRKTSRRRISARMLTVLLLLDSPDAQGNRTAPVVGTTRLQKLAFLVQERVEKDLRRAGYFRFDFAYEPEKFGPADLALYQDLEYLMAMNLISDDSTPRVHGVNAEQPDYKALMSDNSNAEHDIHDAITSEASADLDQEETELSFDYLMGTDSEELLHFRVGQRQETVYSITGRGRALIENIRQQTPANDRSRFAKLVEACASIKIQVGLWPLQRLLRYVYRDHPSMISKSIIRDRVLGIGSSQ